MKLSGLAGLLCIAAIFASALPVRAAVHCTFTVATGVAFGAYDVLSSSSNAANGNLAFQCVGLGTDTDSVTVTLNQGNAPTYTPRYMLNGLVELNYNLYLDPATTIIWGDGTGGSSIYGPTTVTNGQTVTLTIYGLIPAGQDVPAGTYGDSITATINY